MSSFRERLAEVLHNDGLHKDDAREVADHLITSGVVADPQQMAHLQETVERKWSEWCPICGDTRDSSNHLVGCPNTQILKEMQAEVDYYRNQLEGRQV